ncbi:efflux RND transporter periplasmic adaptor subunit [Montanilutibacter psychrotolerans]|uniref:Efflux RND transporter periplasmic adaptor subunit n=1 Tax=Montanilutibacter psychrotolerans TaxID=1327343 RepID=A0A3M8SPW8_9GAMM|nr:efflux RND transporter periplasmic adaptor subunit [Lysobacter psychrotolerans]RNF83319.1 efflux RND transporter periplasmic adaptor subunit [Lysobacter psychrotolerans]
MKIAKALRHAAQRSSCRNELWRRLREPGWVICITVLVNLSACSEQGKTVSAPATTPSLTVETVTPRMQVLARQVNASGAIAAWEEIAVGVEVSGLRVTEVSVEVGDTVRRGDVLVRLDARTLRAKAAQSEAALAQAQANAAVAAKRAKRTRELATQHFISQQDADQAEAEAINAEAQLRTVRSALEAARVELDFTEVRSPQDGVVSARSVHPGQVAGATGELLRLIRDRRLEWRAELAEADLTRVTPGMLIRLAGPDGATVEGRVRQVSPALNERRRTGLIYADLPQPGPLRAGMFTSGVIVLGNEQGLVIPFDAVVRRDGRAYAYVVDDQNRARERLIQTAVTAGTYVHVREGLRADERVVARGGGFLGDGDLVRVTTPKSRGGGQAISSSAAR